MRKSTNIPFKRFDKRGFTLLEVMVSVAILAVAVVPMLLLREESFQKALYSKSIRVARELAQRQLTQIALEVLEDEGAGNFEDWPDYRYEYKVTLYDFSGGMSEYDGEYGDSYLDDTPSDSVFDDEEEEIGPMVMRHVEIRIFFPSVKQEEEDMDNEYVIDTYIPVLLTEEQYDRQSFGSSTEEE